MRRLTNEQAQRHSRQQPRTQNEIRPWPSITRLHRREQAQPYSHNGTQSQPDPLIPSLLSLTQSRNETAQNHHQTNRDEKIRICQKENFRRLHIRLRRILCRLLIREINNLRLQQRRLGTVLLRGRETRNTENRAGEGEVDPFQRVLVERVVCCAVGDDGCGVERVGEVVEALQDLVDVCCGGEAAVEDFGGAGVDLGGGGGEGGGGGGGG